MRAWILVGGRLVDTIELRRRRGERPDLVIAADGGARHADLLRTSPALWVGDFDSSDDLELPGAQRVAVPRDKNFTDAELALDLARQAGATNITVWGAFGGRLDHTLALALLALRTSGDGTTIELHSGDESAVPLSSRVEVPSVPGQIVSVLAFDDLVGLTLRGVRWELNGADVRTGSGHTVSNEATAARIVAEVTSGRALLTQRWE